MQDLFVHRSGKEAPAFFRPPMLCAAAVCEVVCALASVERGRRRNSSSVTVSVCGNELDFDPGPQPLFATATGDSLMPLLAVKDFEINLGKKKSRQHCLFPYYPCL